MKTRLKKKNKNERLRDYFAAKAMAAFISISGKGSGEDEFDSEEDDNGVNLVPGTMWDLPTERLGIIAIESYEIADQMLIARKGNWEDYE